MSGNTFKAVAGAAIAGIRLSKERHRSDFYERWRAGCKSDEKFKESVIRDLETISLVSALVMTTVFGLLLAPVKEADFVPKTLFLCSLFSGISFSILGSVVSVRTLMMVNSVPSERVADALRALGARRREFHHSR